MGFCFSCCRRQYNKQDKPTDAERQQLLHPQHSDSDILRHQQKRTLFETLTDVLAALHSGKLPSQQQLDRALQEFLRTDFLQIDESAKIGGTLDESLKSIILDAREVIQALLQFGLEKNDDNRVQDLIYQVAELSTQTVSVNVEAPVDVQISRDTADKIQTAASAIPSQNELASDTVAIISSMRTLAALFLTSEAFRLIIGDLLLTVRQIVADTAAQVRRVAVSVEQVSETVETSARPVSGAQTVNSAAREDQAAEPHGPEQSSTEETRNPKEVMLDRIEDIFRRAQASPAYNSALRTLLFIFRKYADRVTLASSSISQAARSTPGDPSIQLIAPTIVPDPRFSRALNDLRVIFERLAGGRSLENLLQTLFKTVHDVSMAPTIGDDNEVRVFFREVGLWLDTALANPSFVSSRAGQDTAARLYDKGSSLISRDTQLSENISLLVDEASSFIETMKTDKTTNKLFNSITAFHSDVLTLLGQTTEKGKHAAQHWRSIVLRLFLGWFLPRLLRAIRVIPMPRVEYVSRTSNGAQIAVAIDALMLSAEEALVPDVLTVQEFAEVKVEVDDEVGAAELTSPNARLVAARRMVDQNRLEGGSQSDSVHGHDAENLESNSSPSPHQNSNNRQRTSTNVTSTSRLRIQLEGLRLAAHDVGYYASYARTPNSWIGYTDEGLLSVDIGRRSCRGEGLALDVELELETATEILKGINSKNQANGTTEEDKLFRISNVQSSLPGLALRIRHSKRWILNSLLSPLVGSIGRSVVPPILNAQVRSTLEKVERAMRDVKSKAYEKSESRSQGRRAEGGEEKVTVEDWWAALLEVFGASGQKDEGSDQDSDSDYEDEEQELYTETYNEIGLTGITHTTVSQAEPLPQTSMPPTTENTLAVGLSAQLLPGKGEPADLAPAEGIERVSPQGIAQGVVGSAREAVEDVQGKVKYVEETAEGAGRKGLEEAVRVRRLAEDTGARVERVERRERRRRGWRSRAFDL